MYSIFSLASLLACGTNPPAPVSQAGLGSASIQVAPLGDFDALLVGIDFGAVDPSEVRVVWESSEDTGEAPALASLYIDEARFEVDDGAPVSQRSIRRDVVREFLAPSAPPTVVAPESVAIDAELAAIEPVEVLSVDRVIRRYSTQTQYCHETAKERYSQVAGRIELAWVIEEGAVSRVEVLDNTTGDEAMASCVARKVQRWRFPSETTEEVRHPFVFQKAI